MMTDPIADLLTRVRNAGSARRATTEMPWSRMKEAIVKILEQEGYIASHEVEGEGVKRTLKVKLAYTKKGGRSVIVGIRRVSRPSLRIYRGAAEAPRVRNGLGVSILSTPQGLLVDREARKQNLGGEVLCEVW